MSSKKEYLSATKMLDFDHPKIQSLVREKYWDKLASYDAIDQIYQYVRDEIPFGYNIDDTLTSSQVLEDGYGQCNTNGNLLMSLLRAVGIPTRFHGFTIYNELQKGAIPNYLFLWAPKRIIHSWVEVYYEERWINLEGFIIDKPYLLQIQKKFSNQCEDFRGYGIAINCLNKPDIDWHGEDTYIQKEGIAEDFGVFNQPEDFYNKHGSNLTGLRRILFRYIFRHLMNHNVNKIRKQGISS
jgi:hypothetical protein